MDGKDLHFEKTLLDQLNADMPGAFERVYQTYVAELLDYATQRLSSLEEARDVVQDVFLNIYERRKKLTINISLKAYLFSALKYKIIDHIRKNANKKYYTALIYSLHKKDDKSIFNDLVYHDLNAIVEKEVQKLPSRIREAFLLSRKKHLSISEIAIQMNISEQTVKNQLTTAMKRLRPVLEKVMVLSIVVCGWL